MSRNKKLSIIAIIFLALYSLTGFLLIPYMAQTILPEKLGNILNRPVKIQGVKLNPYTLTMSIEGFKVMEKNGSKLFLSFNKLFVNVQLSSLLRRGLVVKKISLDTPIIHILRISDKTFNFSDLLEKPREGVPEPTEGKKTPLLPFSISNIQVVNGKIEVEDQVVQKTHAISNLYFTLPFISNFKNHIETHTRPELKVQVNDTQITADVMIKPFIDSMETTLDLNITGIDLSRYFDYLPVDPGFTVTKGLLDLHSNIFFIQEKNSPSIVKVSGAIALSNLELVDGDKNPFVKLKKLDLELAPSMVLEKEIRLAKVTFTKPEIDIVRDKSGNINLPALGLPSESSADHEASAAPQETSQASDLRLFVDNLSVNSAWVRMKDSYVSESSVKTLTQPVEISLGPVQLNAANFSTLPNQNTDFSISTPINNMGDMEANGQFGISPILLNMQFAFKDVAFSWVEPYLQDNLTLAITSGRFSSSGKINATTDENKELKAALLCDASVEDLKTTDKVRGEDFLQMNGLFVKQLDVTYNPTRVALGEIEIQGFTNRMIVHEDGTLNLSRIMIAKADQKTSAETSDKKEPPSDSPAVPVAISQVTLKDIHVEFLDKQIQPNFSMNIKLTKGGIAGLTSENFKAADVSIHGNIDDYAPIEITGKINPLQENLFTDIQFRLKGMELSPFTPYSGKYIGKAIEKGKLSLDLEYLIEKNTLSAKDKIHFDQLTLGKNMESPESLDLPMELVISILQDRKGQINLDIPVSGRLDDPEFSLKNVILQTLVNIVEKAATSPFALVSGITGDGEELQFIEFPPGRDELDEKARLKLDSIITVLYERPGLKLGLTGYVDVQQDSAGLKDMMLDHKIKAQKQPALIQEGVSPGPAEQIEVSAMEEQIRGNIIINDSELRLLALNRAKSVKAHILNDNRIEPGRLFLSEAATLSPEHKDQYAAGRVELSLQ